MGVFSDTPAIRKSELVTAYGQPARVSLRERGDWHSLSDSQRRHYARYWVWFETEDGQLWFGVDTAVLRTENAGVAAYERVVARAVAGSWATAADGEVSLDEVLARAAS